MPNDIAEDLAEARSKLESVREAIQPLLDAQSGELVALVDRLKRMAEEVARIERLVAEQTVSVKS
jgi:hypothetical protein